ncbi:MAG: serine hydrolase [Steroidobacteraceae bacterium]
MRSTVIEMSALIGMTVASALGPVASGAADSEARMRMEQVENQFIPSARADGNLVHPTLLKKRMAELHVPGLSIAVVRDGKIDWAKGYGVIQAGGPPVTTDTLFQAASISKPVTALAVLRLADAGRINLDHQANEYLRNWKIPETSFTAKSKVTVSELLNHTAGINIEGFPGYLPGRPTPTLAQMLRGESPAFGPAITVTSAPGAEFRYAGGGYVILRALLTDVTGRPFEQMMRDTVLLPLGMSHSTFQQPLPTELNANAARPHAADGRVFERGARIYPEQAPDGLWTTASDIAHYILAVQHSLKGNGFLAKQTVERMLTPGKQNWGLGPIIGKDSEHPYFQFSGGNYGYISVFVAYENGDGVAVLTNGEQGGKLGSEVVHTVAEVYGWPDFRPVRRQSAALPPNFLDELVGVYKDATGNATAITRKHNALYLVLIGGHDGPVRLYAQSKNEFLYDTAAYQNFPETVEVKLTFERTPDGRSQLLRQVEGGSVAPFAATRLSSADGQPILAQLRAFALRYQKQIRAPGGAEALRRVIEAIVAGTPENVLVGPVIAEVLRTDRTPNEQIFSAMGPMTSASYQGTTPAGYDTYRVLFAKGDCVFHILVDDQG